MADQNSSPVLEAVRRALGHSPGSNRADSLPELPRDLLAPARENRDAMENIALFMRELQALSGVADYQSEANLTEALRQLVQEQRVRRATLWQTPGLQKLQIAERLAGLGVALVMPSAEKRTLSQCDLGVTEADLIVPETGTLGLFSAPEKPRAVSLLPRVHLALLTPQTLVVSLWQALQLAKEQRYMILISGPSRTADIELTVTLGVHGPQSVYAWVINQG